MFQDMVKHPIINMVTGKGIASTVAAIAASVMIQSLPYNLIRQEIQKYMFSSIKTFFRSSTDETVLVIPEFDGLESNRIYKAAEIYLGSKISSSTKRFMISMPEKQTNISKKMAKDQQVTDDFNGVQLTWRRTLQVRSRQNSSVEKRFYELSFPEKHQAMVMESYLPFILNEFKKIEEDSKILKIHTIDGKYLPLSWTSVKLDHPSTFDTIALDDDLKKEIVDDLERFVKRREYYRKVGKAWKRGYLLYGPPGTGKSSLIAAIANYLKFDIYDLELTGINSNSDLRKLLINTENRSILVVEDIDCTIELENRKAEKNPSKRLESTRVSDARTSNPKQVTLSGLLNFIDGLWSSCGDERIIIFTTNYIDRLDRALLRPGRMDMHILMSYCSPSAFKTLAANYLQISDHSLFPEIDDLLKTKKVTPAEIGEQLLRHEDTDMALQGVIEFLQNKSEEEEKECEDTDMALQGVIDVLQNKSEQQENRKKLLMEKKEKKEKKQSVEDIK